MKNTRLTFFFFLQAEKAFIVMKYFLLYGFRKFLPVINALFNEAYTVFFCIFVSYHIPLQTFINTSSSVKSNSGRFRRSVIPMNEWQCIEIIAASMTKYGVSLIPVTVGNVRMDSNTALYLLQISKMIWWGYVISHILIITDP